MTLGPGDALFGRDGITGPPGEAVAPAAGDPPRAASEVPPAEAGMATDQSTTEGDRGPAQAIPSPRRPPSVPGPARRDAVPARPRIVDEPGILGLSRLSRGRFGSRVFTWFFVLVFALILAQMIMSILYPW